MSKMNKQRVPKIILSGGGTLGPVIPLLAVAEAYTKAYPEAKFIWVGTKSGPEKEVVEKADIPFFAVGAGKWRRYFSLWNIVDIFRVFIAFWQSLLLIWQEKPSLLISCGGFVSVPLHWAAALYGVPMWVHQQDVKIGLANKLMFPFAQKITTALRETAEILPHNKTEWLGNPSRDLMLAGQREQWLHEASRMFSIPEGVPVIFAMGGGTGSASINKLIVEALPHWPKTWHVIHLVGKERPSELMERTAKVYPNYHVYHFFTDEMKYAYAIADVVIGRAGFSTLTEAAALGKAAVILPMYDTHQEDNAKLFAQHNGIVLIKKGEDTGLKLAQIVRDLVEIPEKRFELGSHLHRLLPRPKPERIVQIIDILTQTAQ